MDFLSSIDLTLFYWLSGSDQTPVFFVWFGCFAAKALIYCIPFHLVFLWFCGGVEERKTALAITCSIFLGLVVAFLLGFFFDRPRPFAAALGVELMHHRNNPSFPSNHALIFSAYIGCLYFFCYRKTAYFALILAFFTCWARVFVNVHYPSDIVGGVVVGAAAVWFVCKFLSRLPLKFILNIPPLKKDRVAKPPRHGSL